MQPKTLRVVVCLDVRHSASQNVITGVMKFAATHPEWDLQMRGNHPSNDGFAVGDGLAAEQTHHRRRVAHARRLPSLGTWALDLP